MTWEGCQVTPSCSGGVDGRITEQPGERPSPEYPPDPSPGAPGAWIGFGATDCYVNYGENSSTWMDVDGDLLRDECEYHLARAFAPVLMLSQSDGCPEGEPYWAAKYFDDPGHHHWGEFVRIAYLPAYYRDCGSFDGRRRPARACGPLRTKSPSPRTYPISNPIPTNTGVARFSSTFMPREGISLPTSSE